MNNKHIESRRLFLAGVIAGAFTLCAGPALAVDIKVEITGSNIKRIEGEGALPVQTISRDEINRSGAQNAMEIMNLISANNSAGNVSLSNVIGSLDVQQPDRVAARPGRTGNARAGQRQAAWERSAARSTAPRA